MFTFGMQCIRHALPRAAKAEKESNPSSKRARTENWRLESSHFRGRMDKATLELPLWSMLNNLSGVVKTSRTVDIIDNYFMKVVQKEARDQNRTIKVKDFRKLAEGLLVDHSQAVSRNSSNYQVPALTTNSQLYSYSMDRAISPLEHFRVLQHSKMDFSNVSNSCIRDLAGDSMNMPTVTMVAMALIWNAELGIGSSAAGGPSM